MDSTELYIQAVVAAIAAGLLVVVMTVAIERLGAMGGLVATVPTTIVIISIGFAAQGADLVAAMYFVPIGMICNVLYLVLWRQLPAWCCGRRFSGRTLLWVMLAVCLAAWCVIATALELSVRALVDVGLPVRVAGAAFLALQLAIGLFMAIARPLPDVKAKIKPSWKAYLIRGVAAGSAVLVADLLASLDASAGAVLSVFPAMFATSTFLLSWSHGVELSRGAIAPMALGSTSVPVYAAIFAEIQPLLARDLGVAGATALAVPITWIITVLLTSLPLFLLLRRLKRKRAEQQLSIDQDDGADLAAAEALDAKLAAHSALMQQAGSGGGDDDDDLTALDNESIAAGLLADKL